MGYTTKQVKALETSQALSDGASEFDTVLNISALKSGDVQLVEDDIRAVVDAAKGNTVKVILETCYLTPTEIDLACDISLAAGAHFVKTSTGFGSAGATESAVKAMVSRVGSRGQVKASGGIRDFQIANKMLELGATRLGTSNSVDIINKVSHVKDGSY